MNHLFFIVVIIFTIVATGTSDCNIRERQTINLIANSNYEMECGSTGEDCKWTINGTRISDKHINKKNGTYTLSLVNITYSDSGYYVCLPVNVPEDETNFFPRISVQIYDISIEPNVPRLNLTSNTTYTIKCFGNLPVKWLSEDDRVVGNNTEVQNGKFKYESTLSLVRVNYSNAGYYYCRSNTRTYFPQLEKKTSQKKIQVSVSDILIEPNIPQLNLTLKSTYTIKCFGDQPIQWLSEGGKFIGNNVVVQNGKYKYESTLALVRVDYLDGGFYYCGSMYDGYTIKNKTDLKKIQILVSDILIEPNIPQLNLKLNTPYTIKCFGEVPMKWLSEDGKVMGKNSEVQYGRYKYESTISLARVNYSDGGFYYCGSMYDGYTIKNKTDLKKIQILVSANDIHGDESLRRF